MGAEERPDVAVAPKALQIWQPVELGIEERGRLSWYRTRLEELDERQRVFVVGWPMAQLHYVSVHTGDQVYLGTTIANDALYVTLCTVVQTVLEPQARLTLQQQSAWERMQRREYVRVEVALVPDAVTWIPQPGAEPTPLAARILDLSAGGARLRVPTALPVGAALTLTFRLPGTEPLTLKAEVRRCAPVEGLDPPRWDIGCRFLDVPVRVQEMIVRFVFARLRELAKRER